jgi:hypothetical protein
MSVSGRTKNAPRPTSTINSSSRQTTMYTTDTSKGDLQQTGTPDATAASAALAPHAIGFLHPRAHWFGINRKMACRPNSAATAASDELGVASK